MIAIASSSNACDEIFRNRELKSSENLVFRIEGAASAVPCGDRKVGAWVLSGPIPPSWRTVYRILDRFLTSLVRLAVRTERSKDLEIVVLRHENAVLRRRINRPVLNDDDRTLLGAVAAALPRRLGLDRDT